MNWQISLITLGGVVVVLVAWRFLVASWRILTPYVFYSPIDLKKKVGSAGWAVVTGATDGIGKAYSFELAKRGFNIYLVSRTRSKLEKTRDEILDQNYNVEVRTYAYDFNNTSLESYQTMIDELNKVKIGILINNVGYFFEYPEILHKVPGGLQTIADTISVNTLPVTLLTAGILPQMVGRKSGIVVNVGSSAGDSQMAMWSIYSATKKYVSWLSAIIRKEYKPYNIIIQHIAPMLVATKMSGVSDASFFAPSAESFAKSALNTIGNVDDTTGYITHQFQAEFMSMIPNFVMDKMVVGVNEKMRQEAFLRRSAI